MIGRRGILTGLVALVAAPAIVKVSSLMPVNSALQPGGPIDYDEFVRRVMQPTLDVLQKQVEDAVIYGQGNSYLTINDVTRAQLQLFKNDNKFIRNLDHQYDKEFAANGAKIGDVLRIRLPSDFVVSDGPSMDVSHSADAFQYAILSTGAIKAGEQALIVPKLPTALGVAALAVAAAPVIEEVLQKPVTRRFWSK